MLQVQHLVVDDVFEDIAGHARMVEDAADNDRIVRRIVVAEDAARLGLAPTHSRARHQPVKEAGVQVFENRVQIIEVPASGTQKFAPAHLANQVGLAHNVVAGDIFAVTRGQSAVDGPAIHLGQ